MLLAGRWNAALAERLRSTGCTLAALSLDREAANAASHICLTVDLLDVASWSIPAGVQGRRYGAIVLDGVLELCPNPDALLTELQTAIGNGSVVAALLPHTAHGAIRLAMMRGIETEAFAGVASAREAVDLFERCGYHVTKLERVSAPLFGQRNGLPSLEESDFDAPVVAEVRNDPESETASFVVLADLGDTALGDAAGAVAVEDDTFAVAFETAYEAQRRRTQLEEELRAALRELDRLRGRVTALEATLHEQTERHEKFEKVRKK